MTVSISVEHNGTTYPGQIMTIASTTLGYEDHGVLSAWLMCEYPGGGVGVGGFCLDKPRDRDTEDYTRTGTAYGLDQIIRIVETVGVGKWEALKGQSIIVLSEGKGGWGSRAVGIASLTGERVLILQEHADSWTNKKPE